MIVHLTEDQLLGYIHQTLSDAQREAIDQHLVNCAACRSQLADHELTQRYIRNNLMADMHNIWPPADVRFNNIAHRVFRKRKPTSFSQLRQTLSAIVGFVVIAALALFLITLFNNASRPGPASSDTDLLQLDGTVKGALSPYNGQEIPLHVRAPMIDAPDRLPTYRVEATLGPATPELARVWAERLGMSNVRVYQEDAPSGYIAFSDDGQTLHIDHDLITYQETSASSRQPALAQSTPPSPQITQAAADAFLTRVSGLVTLAGEPTRDIELRAVPDVAYDENRPVHVFRIVPYINDVPLIVDTPSPFQMSVGADGEVFAATFAPLQLTAAGADVDLRTVDSVVQDFLDGNDDVVAGTWRTSPSDITSNSQVIYRPSTYSLGSEVTIRGLLTKFIAADGGPNLDLLLDSNWQRLLLDGLELDSLPNSTGVVVAVTGRITAQQGPDTWHLQVSQAQIINESDPNQLAYVTGTVRRSGDQIWIDTSDQLLLLRNAPAELLDGNQVTVSGGYIEDNGMTVYARPLAVYADWQMIEIVPTRTPFSTATPIPVSQSSALPTPIPANPNANVASDSLTTQPSATSITLSEQTATPLPFPTMTPYDLPGQPDRFEPNDDFDSAAPIELNVKHPNLNFMPANVSGAATGDKDFFSVQVEPDMQITCQTLDLSRGTDTNIILFDQDQNGVEGNDDVHAPSGHFESRLTYEATYSGPLYIQVSQVFTVAREEGDKYTYSLECFTDPRPIATPVPTQTPFATATPIAVLPLDTSPISTPLAIDQINPSVEAQAITIDRIELIYVIKQLDPATLILEPRYRLSGESSDGQYRVVYYLRATN